MIAYKSTQIEAIGHLSDWKVGALFMSAGSGKTRVACELINAISEIDLVLWFGPLRTITAGEEGIKAEIAKWGMRPPIVFFGVESISASDRIYLQAMNVAENARHLCVIVDESLKIKNAEAKRTKRLLLIGTKAEYKFILNGTPFTKNIQDIWAQMEFLSPKILNMSANKFKNTFCNYKILEWGAGRRRKRKEIITGFENIDYMYSLIRHYIYECDLELNVSVIYSEMRYTIAEEEKTEYNEIKKEMLSSDYLDKRNNNIFLEMTNKMQHSYCITPDKFRAVDDIIKNLDRSKVIIFTKYIISAKECAARYPDLKVLSYQKESFGLNLQRYCYTIYFDKIWDYALRNQSYHRTYRIGQAETCRYWDLTGDVGLESIIDKNMSKKISMIEYFKSVSKSELKEDL